MLASDIVLQLAQCLPDKTDLFTENYSVTSLTMSGTTATATTDTPHGFTIGKGVRIVGAQTPILISSFTRSGKVGTITTDSDHDFTLKNKQIGAISGTSSKVAEVVGANESEFNGNFTITSVPNRRTLVVDMEDSGPTSATGTINLLNGSSVFQQYNGLFGVKSVPTTTSFTYELTVSDLPDAFGTIEVRGDVRISAVASEEQIEAAITEKLPNELWAFVVLGDVVASKNRNIESDEVDNLQRGNYYRQQLAQPFNVYVVFPTAVEQIAGRQARDLAEELFQPICQCLLGWRFDSKLYAGKDNPVNFISHGFGSYNTAYYIHNYTFQQSADVLFEDTIQYDPDFAFRDIKMSIKTDLGEGVMNSDINLDEEPLP